MSKPTPSKIAKKPMGSLVRYGDRLTRLDDVTPTTIFLFDLVEDDYILLPRASKRSKAKPTRKAKRKSHR